MMMLYNAGKQSIAAGNHHGIDDGTSQDRGKAEKASVHSGEQGRRSPRRDRQRPSSSNNNVNARRHVNHEPTNRPSTSAGGKQHTHAAEEGGIGAWLQGLGRDGVDRSKPAAYRHPMWTAHAAAKQHKPSVDEREARAWRTGEKVLMCRKEESALAQLQQKRAEIVGQRARKRNDDDRRRHGAVIRDPAGSLLYVEDGEELERYVWSKAGKVCGCLCLYMLVCVCVCACH
jgi:hypothetical protein